MRYLIGFLCVCALGVMPLVGCSETAGDGGSGGSAGDGGSGGSTGDVFPCTEQGIREAIAEGGGPHTFDCDGAQTVVTEAEIVIDNDVILDGEGNLTVDGNEDHRVFSVPEVGLDPVTVELHGFTVTRGRVAGEAGAGISNAGELTLVNSNVRDNVAESTPEPCGAACRLGVGGGISNGLEGTLTLTRSTVSGNTADYAGGIRGSGTMSTITDSTVSGNTAVRAGGGGIACERSSITMTNSTVSGNTAGIDGGAIYLDQGELTSTGSLIGGDCSGGVISGGYNIESPGDTCGFDQAGDLVNITEGQLDLGPLADNGGDTMTHALGAGSVAIDHIPAVDCEVDEDQRGQPRPETDGTMCDVGSFERQPIPAEGCLQSGGTISTGLCCQAVESFPNTCAIGACGCAPDASHEVAICICPTNTCFDGESCVAQ